MMSRILSCLPIAVLFVLCGSIFLITGGCTVSATFFGANNVQQRAEYLLDENFTYIDNMQKADVYPSGWDVFSAGGTLSYSPYSWFKISDTNSRLPVTMSHNISAQTAGAITLEYRFKQVIAFDGAGWQLCENDTIACGLYTSNRKLYAYSSGADPVFISYYMDETEYGVKIVADITSQTFSVYVDGSLKASGIPFAGKVSSIDRFKVTTGVETKGEMYLATVKIYKNYAVNERFITTMKNLPSDWNAVNSGGKIAVEASYNASNPDYLSLRMDAANAFGTMQFTKSIPELRDFIVWEYKVFYPDIKGGSYTSLTSEGNPLLTITAGNGSFAYSAAGEQQVQFYSYIPNLWYSIRVKLDTKANTADIYINGKLKVKEVKIPNASPDTVGFYSPQGSGVTCLDDLILYSQQPLPADYVPVPNKIASSDGTLVGIQSCSIWREGTHLGWDKINPYPERIPIQGFYDEGNPEEADLETKWLAEHGIDYQIYCWFRPALTKGRPIKDSDLSQHLHEGYFKSEYSDYVKFAIMWENLSPSLEDSKDFRNNIVPFWIEYYFKDPRYVTIDNKPLISIYGLDSLVRDFGSVEEARAAMDYLRQECKAAGFDDVILLAVNVYSYNIKDFGIDAVYSYSWGNDAGYPDVQKANLEKMRDSSNGNMIATISMGRDDSIWGRSPGYFSTVEEFAEVAEWVKNEFMPTLPENSVGRKTVLIDNWNEFGEGHYIMPTSLRGFGYLDAIRNVFTKGGEHKDYVPTQRQKDRICVLYPKNRVIPKPEAAPVAEIPSDYFIKWDFNKDGDTEGWVRTSRNITDMKVQNGTLSFTSTGIAVWMISPEPLVGICGDEAPYIHIRMKNSADDTSGKIYFITEADKNWAEDKAIRFAVKPKDTEYTDYYIYMWSNAKWTGTIRAIRIDPINWMGDVSIDFIGITRQTNPGVSVLIDGKISRFAFAPQVMDGCVMLPASEILKKLGGKMHKEGNNKFTLVINDNVCILTAGSSTTMVNGTQVYLEHSAVLSDNMLYIPASLLKSFGLQVFWDGQNQVSISAN